MREMLKILKTTLCAVAAAALLGGCADDLLPDEGGGNFVGTWNGTVWTGQAYAVLRNDSLTVVGHRADPQHAYDEYVQARVRFTGPDTYTFAESDGQLAQVVGGDAGTFPPAAGTLVIRDYNASAHTISGDITLHAGSVQPAWDVSGTFQAYVYASFTEVPTTR